MRRQGRQPSTRLLTAETISAPPEIAGHLIIPAGAPLIHIARLRLADGHPVYYESRHLSQSLCPDLLNEDLESASIHRLIVHKYGIPLVRMTHTVEVGCLTESQAALLQTEPQTTAFYVDRLTYTERGGQKIPVVWYQAIYREDNYHISAISKTSSES